MKWKFKTIMRCFLFLVTFSVVGGSVLYNTNISFRKTINNAFNIEDEFLKEDAPVEDITDKNVNVSNVGSILASMQEQMYEKDKSIQQLNAEIDEQNQTLTARNNEIVVLKNEKKDIESQLAEINSQLLASQNANAQLLEIKADLETRLTEKTTALENKVNEFEEAQQTILQLTEEKSALELEKIALEEESEQLRSDYEAYQDFIESVRGENQIVVTFDFNGTCFNTQLIEKGSKVAVLTPEDTEDVRFNHWTINGEQIDISSYEFIEDTQVIADVIQSKTINFEYNGEIIDTIKVFSGETISKDVVIPEDTNYLKFNNWTLNGEIVDLTTFVVSEDVTFVADLTEYFEVNFYNDTTLIETQFVADGTFATAPEETPVGTGVFKGWSLDKVDTIDVSALVITENINLYAIFETPIYELQQNFTTNGTLTSADFGQENLFENLAKAEVNASIKVSLTLKYTWNYTKKTMVGQTSNLKVTGSTDVIFTLSRSNSTVTPTVSNYTNGFDGLSVYIKSSSCYYSSSGLKIYFYVSKGVTSSGKFPSNTYILGDCVLELQSLTIEIV